MFNSTKTLLSFFTLALFLVSCKTTQTVTSNSITDDGIIEFTILQINDVYEISTQEGGKVSGMARLATLHQQLKKENPNTLFVLAGDFLNPSLYGTIKGADKKPVAGKQMVEAMNTAGVDLVAFGNHEFDLSEAQLQERINLSDFAWVGANVLQKQLDTSPPFTAQSPAEKLQPFYQVKNGQAERIAETYTWQINDADGTMLDIGFFGATINSNPKDYVVYQEFKAKAVQDYLDLNCSTDFVLGLTHLSIREDMELAAMLPNVPLIMGGHEHKNMKVQVGDVVITKADADAKTAYVHRFKVNNGMGTYEFTSELVKIGEQLAQEPTTKAVVSKWETQLNERIKDVYPEPNKVIYTAKVPLDASRIRYEQTNLGAMMCQALIANSPQPAVASMMNSGSVRIEDHLENDIEAIGIFKTLPFPGYVSAAEMKGDTLLSILKTGLVEKYGSGSYLQVQQLTYNVENHTGTIAGQPIQANQNYVIAINDYLLKRFVKEGTLEKKDYPKGKDVRVAIIEYMDGLGK
ncbi:MAG: bifunctional UDP-sugar hydrolase/5'-nucleotidase [Saprospiraceae bacterium]